MNSLLLRLRTGARAVKGKVWSERVKTESETRPMGVLGWHTACRENVTSAPRVFPKPIIEKKDDFAVLIYT